MNTLVNNNAEPLTWYLQYGGLTLNAQQLYHTFVLNSADKLRIPPHRKYLNLAVSLTLMEGNNRMYGTPL